MEVNLTPDLIAGELDRIQWFEEELGTRLAPLGELEAASLFLVLADDGRVFAVCEDAYFVGASFETGLKNIVTGTAAERGHLDPSILAYGDITRDRSEGR